MSYNYTTEQEFFDWFRQMDTRTLKKSYTKFENWNGMSIPLDQILLAKRVVAGILESRSPYRFRVPATIHRVIASK